MPERKNSEARIRANNKYAAKAYDRINIALPKGRKAELQAHAQARGESLNGFIGRAIAEAVERDKRDSVASEGKGDEIQKEAGD